MPLEARVCFLLQIPQSMVQSSIDAHKQKTKTTVTCSQPREPMCTMVLVLVILFGKFHMFLCSPEYAALHVLLSWPQTIAHTVCTTVCTALNPEKRGALRERRQPCNILRLRGSLNHYDTVICDVNDGLF